MIDTSKQLIGRINFSYKCFGDNEMGCILIKKALSKEVTVDWQHEWWEERIREKIGGRVVP